MGWRVLASERFVHHADGMVRLVDDFTGLAPIGRLSFELEADRAGTWVAVARRPVLTPSGFVGFPGLGFTAQPVGKPAVRHRVRVSSDLYRPLYGAFPGPTSIEFDVHPYNTDHPPASPIPVPCPDIFLLPAAPYPFPREVPVLRGRVVDPAGDAVTDAFVVEGARERVLTDRRGVFSLPLRWIASGAFAWVDVVDRAGHTATVIVNVPSDLDREHLIPVS